MERGVAEGELQRPGSLHEEADVVLVGHADSAVHLQGLVRDQDQGVGAAGLGVRDLKLRVAVTGVERSGRRHGGRPGQLDLDEHLRGPVFERLEGPDQHAELAAGLEVLDRALEGLRHHAEHLAADGDRGPVHDSTQRLQGAADVAQDAAGSHLDTVQPDNRRVAGVDPLLSHNLEPVGGRRNEEERQTVVAALRSGRDQEPVRADTADHLDLLARQGPASAVRLRSGLDPVEPVPASRLEQSRRQALLPVDQWRQPCGSLFRGAGVGDQPAAEDDRRHERLGRQAPAHCLRDENRFRHAHAEATMTLGKRNAEPAEVGHLGPHRGAVGEFIAVIAELPLAVHAAVLRNELGRGPGEHVLGRGENESGHQSGSPSTRFAMMLS